MIGQTWDQVASMPEAKHHPVSFALGPYGYAVTGSNDQGDLTDDVFVYDSFNDEWNELSSFPGPNRSFAIGQAYNGKGYLGFGLGYTAYLNDIWEFDPNTGNWTFLTNCECTGRRHPAFIVKDDKIYVGLGDDLTGDLDDWHIYDMVADTWTEGPDIPSNGRHHPFMFEANDEIFAGMGHSSSTIFDDWYRFDTSTNSWQSMNDFPGEARVAGTQFGHQGKGYVLSGDGDNHSWMPTGEFWEYDAVLDSWTELEPHPGISRWAPGSFVIDGSVYLFGGENRQQETLQNSMWSYPLSVPSSVEENLDRNRIGIYPNPAESVLTINSDEDLVDLQLVSATGKVLLTPSTRTFDVSFLVPGFYFLNVQTASDIRFTEKVLIQ